MSLKSLNISEQFLVKSASYVSIFVSFLMLCMKTYGWIMSDAQSLLSSFIDSMFDMISSIINMVAINISFLPPNDEYRFGREKYQDLAIFSQSILFIVSCFISIFAACKSLYFREVVTNVDVGVDVMLLSTLATFMLVLYQQYVIYKTKSKIITLDKIHYLSDLLTNIFIIASLYLSQYIWFLDAVAAICVSCYIMYFTYELFISSVTNLIDKEFPKEEKQKILKVIATYPIIEGIHELKTRYGGNKPFIQFHIEMDGKMSLQDAHEVAASVSKDLKKIFPSADIIIHEDPVCSTKIVKFREQI